MGRRYSLADYKPLEPTVRVRLSEAAHELLETDRDEMNVGRRIAVDGAYVVGTPEAIAALRDDFASFANGWAGVDNPGACKRTAKAAIKAIDRVLAK